MQTDYRLDVALTLPMLSLMALDELRIAAKHRRTSDQPVFLGLVRTQAFWQQRSPHAIRCATSYFRLGEMMALFERRLDYGLLDGFQRCLSGAVWMMVDDLRIVDGSSFVILPDDQVGAPVFTAQDSDVAVRMNIDTARGHFRLTAAVV